MSPPPARSRAPMSTSQRRGPQILLARVSGQSIEAIAEREGLTRKRVEKLLRDELRRRWVAPSELYARLQIARLEAMAARLAPLAETGEPQAIDRMLRILDRLDRYHGFGKGFVPRDEPEEGGGRERLLAKLNAMAARMIAARKAEEA